MIPKQGRRLNLPCTRNTNTENGRIQHFLSILDLLFETSIRTTAENLDAIEAPNSNWIKPGKMCDARSALISPTKSSAFFFHSPNVFMGNWKISTPKCWGFNNCHSTHQDTQEDCWCLSASETLTGWELMIETSPATRPGCSTKEAPWPGNCGNQEWWVWLLCNFLLRLIFSIYPTTWWLNHPFEEYMLVNRDLNHFPKVRWQNNKSLKPAPRKKG